MAAVPVDTIPKSRSRPPMAVRRFAWPRRLMPTVLLAPSLLFLAVFFAVPALGLISYSFLPPAPRGTGGLPLTLQQFRHFFATPLYARGLLTALKIRLIAT